MAASPEQLLAVKDAAFWLLEHRIVVSPVNRYESPVRLAETDDKRWQSPPHIQLLNQKLVDLAQRKIKRLIVEMPPRHGKSFMCSKYFPAWYLSQFPHHNVIHAS
jgi:hypothetical protein